MIRRSSLLSFAISSLVLASACQGKKNDKSDKPNPTQPGAGTSLTPGGGVAPPPGIPAPALDNPTGGGPVDPGSVPPASPETAPVVTNSPTPEPEPEPGPPPVPTAAGMQIKDTQFWIHTTFEKQLTFNTPWDETEGDGIIRDATQVPSYADDCLKRAQNTFEKFGESKAFKDKIDPLLQEGVTRNITFLVVTVDSNDQRNNLRRLDRDAYFWHWSDPKKKPSLGMSLYNKGTWVWEVIASPNQCLQPDTKELLRYLDYAAKRIAEKGAKL